MNIQDPQDIFDAIKACNDNTQLWSLSRTIAQSTSKIIKEEKTKAAEQEKEQAKKKGEGFEDVLNILSDKQAARVRIAKDLLAGSGEHKAQSSKELISLLGLDADKQDISIELVQYDETPLECPSCGENLHKPS